MINWQEKMDLLLSKLWEFGPRLAVALILLLAGLFIIRQIQAMLLVMMDRSGLSKEVKPFLHSLTAILLKVLLLLSLAGFLGIETTSFVAVIAAAGFAVGMALQGSLGNFAAGIMILIFRPYKAGDRIRVKDKEGVVEEVQIFNTIMRNEHNHTFVIPNSMTVGDVVTNYSMKDFIRIDVPFPLAYSESFERLTPIILDAMQSINNIHTQPAPALEIQAFESHALRVVMMVYTSSEYQEQVTLDVNRCINRLYRDHKIKIAYPDGIQFGVVN